MAFVMFILFTAYYSLVGEKGLTELLDVNFVRDQIFFFCLETGLFKEAISLAQVDRQF